VRSSHPEHLAPGEVRSRFRVHPPHHGSVHLVSDWRHDRVGAAVRGENPTVLGRLPGGFAVIGDVQWLPGYCVLLTDDPTIDRLSDLLRDKRVEFLTSMERLGEAVEVAATAMDPAFRRVNLEILGNTDAYLHAHVWPRYEWEPPDLVGVPVWSYPRTHWSDPAHQLGPQHDELRRRITEHLHETGSVGEGWAGPGVE
jgi:diadenosine tetraphosphate (Ap4A) HIT family hydrolase